MKRLAIIVIAFFLVQLFLIYKLQAEPVKTSETTFILTEDDPTVEYKVATSKDLIHSEALAIKAGEDIKIVEFISDDILEGMNLINAKVVTFTYKNVDVYFYDGKTYFIIHK